MPTYSTNIPQPGDDPSVSQNQILENFQVLNTAFSQDHSAFNAPTQGQHKQITFPVSPVTGQPFTYLANQIGLQSLNQLPTSRPDIWMSRGVATAFPITGFDNGSISSNGAVSWSYLPSGLLFIGGQATTSAGTVTITFGTTAAGGLNDFPGFSQYVSFITAIRIDNSGSSTTVMRVKSFTLTTATFGLANGSTDSTFFWSATGM